MLPALEAAELPADAIEVGRIADAWGIKGWFKVLPHSARPRRFFLPSAGSCSRPSAAPRPFPARFCLRDPRSQGTLRLASWPAPHEVRRPQRGRGAARRARLRAALQLSHRRRRRVLLGRPDRPGSGQPRRRGAGPGAANCCPPARRPCWCWSTQEDGKPVERMIPFVSAYRRRGRPGRPRDHGRLAGRLLSRADSAPCASTSSPCFPNCSRPSWRAA